METRATMTDFKLLIDADVELAETPIWDSRVERWYWTDLFSGDVHCYDPKHGGETVHPTNSYIGSAIPTTDPEKLLVSLTNGLHILDLTNNSLKFIADPEHGNVQNRYNDTRVDSRGRVFMSSVSKLYGTSAYQPDMLGGFYMVERDGSVRVIEEKINQFNAMVWNRDDSRMYVVDTYNQTLLAYDYDPDKGPVSPSRVVLEFGKLGLGMPDGINIDENDTLYVCHWTGQISVWDNALQPMGVIPFPVEFACCGGFGGPDMRDFLVASSKYCYAPDALAKNPGAGGIFAARSAVRGMGDHFYIL